MDCTTPDCDAPTDLYLCNDCIRDLDVWLKLVPFLFGELDPVHQATKVVHGPGGEGGNGTRKAGSKPPTNLDAGQLRANLAMLPRTAQEDATRNPQAGNTLPMAQLLIRNAETLVYGPEPATPRNPEQVRAYIGENVPKEPMRVKDLVAWLNTGGGLNIKPTLIRKWEERGIITRTNPGEWGPTYDPTQILIIINRHK